MGYIKHQMVIATLWGGRDARADELRAKLKEIGGDDWGGVFELLLVGPTDSRVNSTVTYTWGPDGSKEGWETSNAGDRARAAFFEHFEPLHADVVEVSYGGDFGMECGVEAHAYATSSDD